MKLCIGDVRGMINLCIPFNAIERIGNKLSANNWVSYGRSRTSPENIDAISSSLSGSVVELVALLADTRITTRDLIGLRVGDIITTRKDVESTLVVQVEGVPKFRARPGQLKGHKAVEIDEQMPVKSRLAVSEE